MAEFKFSCPHCDQHILVDAGYAGVQINCPACLKLITVPEAPGAAQPPPPPVPAAQRPAARSPAAPVAARGGYQAPQPPAQKTGSSVLKKVLVISAIVVGLAVLGGGGWFGYTKLKARHDAAVAARGNPAAMVPTPSATQSAGAVDILTKVQQAYTNLTSLGVEGNSVSVIDLSAVTAADLNPKASTTKKKPARRPTNIPKAMTNTTEVTIKLARPDLYCIEGRMKMSVNRMSMTNIIATWSQGGTNYALMYFNGGAYKNFTTVADRKSAFMMNGQSGGLAMAIPQLFFNDTEAMDNLITDWGQTDDDAVNGQDCYTLTAKIVGQKLKIWVSKASYMILQSQITLGAPVSDADIETAIGTFDTDTNKTQAQVAQEKTMAKQQAAMMTKIRGTITETYDNVQPDETFAADDFDYPVPRGVRLVTPRPPPAQP